MSRHAATFAALLLTLAATAADAAPVIKKPAALAGRKVAPSISAADQQAVVAAHNALRAEVGVGPLVWDAALATFAQNHVKTLIPTCALAHSGGPPGENLASWTGNAGPANAVALWAAEKSKYAGAGGAYTGPADGAGHYTQVIWKATTKVGCARATCTQNGMSWSLVSCNYDPRGNVMGERVY
jgi:pathogenesis-related protein 1